MAKSKYFPDLKNGEDLADVEQVESAFSEIESDINTKADSDNAFDGYIYIAQAEYDPYTETDYVYDNMTEFDDYKKPGVYKVYLHDQNRGDPVDCYATLSIVGYSAMGTGTIDMVRQSLTLNNNNRELDANRFYCRTYDTTTEKWSSWTKYKGTATNLSDGKPTGSLISIGAGKVISKNAVALGKNSVAGAMCFKITAYDDANKTYTLDSIKGLEVGDVFSLKLRNNYDDYGSITAISGNVVTVDKYCKNEDNSDNLFRVAAKPECGTTDFGMNAIAIGDNCKAVAEEAFSTGKDNESIGKYGVTMGKNCKAAYGSFAGGRDISVLGQNSFGFGFGGYIPGTLSYGMGRGIKILSNDALAFGYCAETRAWGGTAIGWKAISASDKQVVLGCNNIIDVYGKYLYILGNGGYDTRSNAHTIDWDGNAWFAGDVESEKYGKLSDKMSKNDGVLKSEAANAVKITKNTISGIVLEDVSQIKHKVNVEIDMPNILTYPFKNTTKTEAGLTFTDNKDGSITVNGTSTSAVAFYFKQGNKPISTNTNSYVLSGCQNGGSDTKYRLDVTLYNGKSVFAQYKDYGGDISSFTVPDTGWDNYNVKLWIASGQKFNNVKITPKLSEAADFFNINVYDEKGSGRMYTPSATGKCEISSLSPYMEIIAEDENGFAVSNVPFSVTYNVDTAKAIEVAAESATANKQDKINIDTTTDLYNDLATLKVNTLYKPKVGIEGVDVVLPSAQVGDFIQVDFYTISTNPVLSVEAPSGIMDLDLKPEQNKIYSLYFDWGVIGVDSDNNINEGWRFSYTEYDPLKIYESSESEG